MATSTFKAVVNLVFRRNFKARPWARLLQVVACMRAQELIAEGWAGLEPAMGLSSGSENLGDCFCLLDQFVSADQRSRLSCVFLIVQSHASYIWARIPRTC